MNNDNFIRKFITFYKTKKGKAVCFFGFYLIFFIILIAFINVNPTDTPNIEDVKEEVLYNTALLENNDYTYNYVIESNEKKEFNGIKNDDNTELNEYEYNYFLNLYNIKQLVKILKYFNYDFNKIRTASFEELIEIEGIGDILAKSIIDYFENENNAIVIDELLKEVNIEIPLANESADKLKGLTFVITGSLDSYENRDELKAEIESFGGKVAGSVSSKTNYLINNDILSNSSKNKTAKSLGIPIITEAQYIEKFK